MSPVSPRPLRTGILVSSTVLALLAAMPSATAEGEPSGEPSPPVATSPVATSPVGTSPVATNGPTHPEPTALLPGLNDDPFGEHALPVDPYVVPQQTWSGVAPAVPSEPLAGDGAPLDPGQLPAAWLVSRPAEQITPSTPEQLMSSTTGYPGYQAGAATTATNDALPDAVPAPPTKDLPTTLDAAPPWEYSYSCDPNDKPGMIKFAQLVSAHYGRPGYYTSRSCVRGAVSEHYEGRALDWTMNAYDPAQKAIGDSVAQWITANNGEMARRFGIQAVIWNRRSWYLWSPYWRDYNGASPHTDHVHFSFTWDGAMGRTSWWDGTPVTAHDYGTCRVYAGQYAPRYTGHNPDPCATSLPQPPASPYPVVLPHATNDYVRIAQRHLGFTGGAVDGSFGPATLSALLAYQARYAVPVTGVLDNATWAKMLTVGIPDPGDPVVPPPTSVERLSGADRWATAAAVSKSYPTGGEVFVTTGADFPDALSAAARAGSSEEAVLLVKDGAIPASTTTALTRIKPTRITVVGGTTSVSPAILEALDAYTTGPVRRLGGDDRYSTAAAVAADFGSAVPVAYDATGTSYPEALIAASRAGLNNGPVLLTDDAVPGPTAQAMEATNPFRVVVVGSTNAVSTTVAEELRDYTVSGNLQRVSGGNRFATAAEMSSYYPPGQAVVYVASGYAYADSLTAAAVAGRDHAPLLLVNTSGVPDVTAAALDRLDPARIVVVGGPSSVPDAVLSAMDAYLP